MKTAAVILAAGFSSRMGSDKALLRFGDKTALERLVYSCQAAGIARIVVVTGQNHAALEQLQLPVELVRNPAPEQGMFSSITLGTAQLDPRVEAFFVQPVDCPLVSPHTLRLLMDALQQQMPYEALIPCCGGKKGHPPLLKASLRERIAGFQGDDGLRGLLAISAVGLVSTADTGVLLGMNTPAEYAALQCIVET